MTKPYILILYYSNGGSVASLAKHISNGVNAVQGIEAKVRTVPNISANCEAIEEEIPQVGPIYATHEDLNNCSGLILGSPTRFGNMAAPLKYFLDSTSTLWIKGALVHKPAAVFSSSGSMHGGQEMTLISMMIPLLHHGMIIAGLPYTEESLSNTITGGTPYGPTHVAGHKNNLPISQDEENLCKAMGTRIATLGLKLNT